MTFSSLMFWHFHMSRCAFPFFFLSDKQKTRNSWKESLSFINTRQLSTILSSAQFSSVAQLCPTLRPHESHHPGLPVHHQLLEITQTHVHWVGDAIQPLILCHLLLLLPSIFPSLRVFSNESALHIKWPKYWSSASASVFPMNIQDWSPLEWTGWISLQSKGLSRVFSNITVQKQQFFGIQLSL